MDSKQTIAVALVRGDSLNAWEGGLWQALPSEFAVTGFCSRRNLYSPALRFPIERLPASTDSRLVNAFWQRATGQFQRMVGLENSLEKFAIAHTAEISYFYTAQAVRAKKNNPKLKVVTTVWDNSFGRYEYNYWPFFKSAPAWWRKKINAIIQENAKGVDMFLPVTAYSAEMLRCYGVPDKKIRIVTPAVIPSQSNTRAVQEALGLLNVEVYLMVNRLVKEKGIYDVLYAWKLFIEGQPQSAQQRKVLCIIGSGPEQQNFYRLIRDLGLSDSVRTIPSLPNPEVRALCGAARALILGSMPSPVWQEQFGYVLAEAICQQCPVISTYSGAIPEVVGSAGLLTTPGNPVSIRDALVQISSDTVYQSYKAHCITEAKRFAPENFVQQVTSIYHELLA